jgi:hypothetical protein
MSRAKQASKRKRGSKAIPVLGAAGLSLTLASGPSAAMSGLVDDVLTQSTTTGHQITLREEEVADVSLATFYVFDKENAGPVRTGGRLAMGACGACGGCAGCGGVGWACAWTGSYYTAPAFGGDGDAPPVRHRYYAPRHVQKKY